MGVQQIELEETELEQTELAQTKSEKIELEETESEQTELVRWMPIPESQNSIFSVYRTEYAIEIHPGCEVRVNARLVCTHYSYEDAWEFSELLGQQAGLPVRDYTHQ